MAPTGKIILEFLNDFAYFVCLPTGFLMRELEKSRRATQSALKRLEDRGEIERTEREGRVLLQITQRGKEKINRSGFSLKRKSRNWDGRWYLVSFDIPETQKTSRNLLRKKLLILGLGKLQRSLWISPYEHTKEVRKIVNHYHLEKYVELFRSQLLSPKEPSLFASQIWDLEGLSRRYIQFIERYRPRLSKFKEDPNHSEDSELFKLERAMREELSSILLSDPQLPDELLPKGFREKEAHRLFKECVKLLRQSLNRLPKWSKRSHTKNGTAKRQDRQKREEIRMITDANE